MGESFLEMGPKNVGDWEDAHMTEHLRHVQRWRYWILRGIGVIMFRIAKCP